MSTYDTDKPRNLLVFTKTKSGERTKLENKRVQDIEQIFELEKGNIIVAACSCGVWYFLKSESDKIDCPHKSIPRGKVWSVCVNHHGSVETISFSKGYICKICEELENQWAEIQHQDRVEQNNKEKRKPDGLDNFKRKSPDFISKSLEAGIIANALADILKPTLEKINEKLEALNSK